MSKIRVDGAWVGEEVELGLYELNDTTIHGVDAAKLITGQGPDVNGYVFHANAAAESGYGMGQAFLVLEEGGGDATDSSGNGSVLFRVDRHGNLGTTGGIHVASNFRWPGGLTQAVWLDPRDPATNHLVMTGVAGMTGRFVEIYNSSSTLLYSIDPGGMTNMHKGARVYQRVAGEPPLRVYQLAGATDALTTWFNSGGTGLAAIGGGGQVLGAAGDATIAGLGFLGDLDTGLYLEAAGIMSVTVAGTKRAQWSADGLQVSSGWGAFTGSAYNTCVFIQPNASTAVGQLVKAAASQSVDITQWQTSAAAITSRVDKAGRIGTRVTTAPADGDVATGEAILYVDTTTGQPKIKIKIKDGAGTPFSYDLGGTITHERVYDIPGASGVAKVVSLTTFGYGFDFYAADADTQPLCRIGTLGISMGPGGSTATDWSMGRAAAGVASLGTGNQLRVTADPSHDNDLARKVYVDNKAKTIDKNTVTAGFTLALADAGRVVEMNSASPQTVTVPPNSSVAFPVGSIVPLYRMGTGTVSVAAGAGVTINSAGGVLTLRAQHSEAALRKRATDEWVLSGDLG